MTRVLRAVRTTADFQRTAELQWRFIGQAQRTSNPSCGEPSVFRIAAALETPRSIPFRGTLIFMSHKDHANTLEKWANTGKEGLPPVLAATVILLRDGPTGLETLMLRRNSKIVFGGMWVFPGGRVDPEDWEGVIEGDVLAASRRAATRESVEETGLEIDPDLMLPFSHWTPPPITPKRFLTWFFVARAGDGEVEIDHGEIHESDWMAPAEALRRQREREIELAPPTFVSLSELAGWARVDEVLSFIRSRTPERFETRISVLENVGPVAMWHGDAGYEEGEATAEGARHRLTMTKGGPWSYDRTR